MFVVWCGVVCVCVCVCMDSSDLEKTHVCGIIFPTRQQDSTEVLVQGSREAFRRVHAALTDLAIGDGCTVTVC